jgi:glycosyltransferase involved in cell wall biosynthesis
MIVLSIGTDRKIFEEGSAPRARMVEYGTLFKELHIIIFTKAGSSFEKQQIAPNVWIYPTNSKHRLAYPFDARTLFKRELVTIKPDVITTQDPFETGLAGWLIKRMTKATFHIQIHTDFLNKYFMHSSLLHRVRVMLAFWLLPKADGIRAVSDRIRLSLATIDDALVERTTVLPIYTDTEKFRNAPLVLDLHKQYTQFSFIILMASRLTAEKNISFALKVMKDIVTKHPEAGLLIVGDGPEKRYLQALALRYHLDRNVVFESFQPELVSYYRTADVFLSTSLYEGYGLTLVEAAASGCPIITSDVGIAKQLVEENVTGYVCDVSHALCFTEKILSFIEDQERFQALKQSSQTRAGQKVSLPKAEYLQNYKASLEYKIH